MEGDTWEEGRRLEGEKVTVVEIFGGGVGGFGSEDGDGDGDGDGDDGIEDEDDEGALDLGAKKREITCCFCFPIAWWCLLRLFQFSCGLTIVLFQSIASGECQYLSMMKTF